MVNDMDYLNDYDWVNAFDTAGYDLRSALGANVSADPVLRGNVTDVYYHVDGENEGDNWRLIGRLNDGRYFFLSAGCDYTGWDCIADGYIVLDNDLDHLIRFGVPQGDRADLGCALADD